MVESASTKIDSLANFLIFRCFQGIANQQTRHNQNQPIATGAGPSLKNMNPNEKSVNMLVRGLIVDEREDEKEVVEVVAVEPRGGFWFLQNNSSPRRHVADWTPRAEIYLIICLRHSTSRIKINFKNFLFDLILATL